MTLGLIALAVSVAALVVTVVVGRRYRIRAEEAAARAQQAVAQAKALRARNTDTGPPHDGLLCFANGWLCRYPADDEHSVHAPYTEWEYTEPGRSGEPS